MAIALAKKIDADIVMASDPDADRVGMACKDDKGEWVLINGNQTCLIFLYYIIKNRIAMGKMQPNDFIVKTIVTTELIKAVADKNKIEMRDCYTGFKWIAREIRLSEGKQQYIGGGEESYGFLAEDFVRDKDAVSACSLLAEICAWAKDQGKTLYDVLMEIYVEYGFSKETTVNVVKPGKSGAEEIKAMMDNFRANPPKEIGGSAVSLIKDYKTLELTDAQGNVSKLDMPETSNVLQYFTVDGTKISVRPSGTEPKIKFYIEVKGEMGCPKCYTSADAEAEKKWRQCASHSAFDRKEEKCVYSVRRGVTREAAPLPFASVLKENLNKDLNPMVDEQNVCREVKYRQIAVTHRLVDVNESRFIRSCSFVSVCFPQSAF